MKSRNNKRIVMGIDTSCYTTSIAAITLDGELIFSKKIGIKVKAGEKGVRQSEGVFQHINNLGDIMADIGAEFGSGKVAAVCASNRPRPVEGSYMPVFIPGYRFAQSLAGITGARLYTVSHQEGHISAARWDSGLEAERFMSIHLSGGTSEILLVASKSAGYDTELVGGTRDISAGQLLDRIGVKLGYEFPCGKNIDINAIEFAGRAPKLKVAHDKGYFNLSGAETELYKIIDGSNGGIELERIVSYMALDAVCSKLYRAIVHVAKVHGCYDVLFAGGVSSSRFIAEKLSPILLDKGIRAHWCKPEYALDNAVGTALIGRNFYYYDNGDEDNET